MSRDVPQVFADIDAFDPGKFVAHLTPDATFRFANAAGSTPCTTSWPCSAVSVPGCAT